MNNIPYPNYPIELDARIKVNEEMKNEIKTFKSQGYGSRPIARMLGISQSTALYWMNPEEANRRNKKTCLRYKDPRHAIRIRTRVKLQQLKYYFKKKTIQGKERSEYYNALRNEYRKSLTWRNRINYLQNLRYQKRKMSSTITDKPK